MEKQTLINAGAVAWIRFGVFHNHYAQLGNSWQWYQHNANRRRTRLSPQQDKRKEDFQHIFHYSERYYSARSKKIQEWQYAKKHWQQDKEENIEMRNSLMKKLRQSWMCCSKQIFLMTKAMELSPCAFVAWTQKIMKSYVPTTDYSITLKLWDLSMMLESSKDWEVV